MALSLLVFLLSLLSAATPTASLLSSIGVTYTPVSPTNSSHVASALQSLHVSSVHLLNPDPSSIHSFAYSNISLLLSIPNSLVAYLAQNRLNTDHYLHTHVLPFYPHSRISAISVGTDALIHYTVVASGASMEEALEATKILAEDCRRRGTAFRLGAVLRDVLEKFLPDDVHTRSSGRVHVALLGKEDLINAVFTSSFIPGYLAPRPATRFRNRLCIDGGLTLFMPPTSATQTVHVCAFPATRLGFEGIGISSDCNPENRATPRELFNWALEPAEDHVLDKLFELGYVDAAVWAEKNPVLEIVRDDYSYIENGADRAVG